MSAGNPSSSQGPARRVIQPSGIRPTAIQTTDPMVAHK